MTTSTRSLITILLIAAAYSVAWAQPANNTCATATPLIDLNQWCSNFAAYTTVGATASGQGVANCFTNANHDVWFSFIAQATHVKVTINGASSASGGTLTKPSVSLLYGSCSGTLTQFQCQTDAATGNNIIEIFGGSLIIGQTYYIQVDGANQGTFELCINNFFAPPDPQSDCIDGVVLCDKSAFSVPLLLGAGNSPDEAGNTTCLGNSGGNSESNSTWYIWTCDQAGTLEFTLTPGNQGDDLDFVVFELPNGSCANKNVLRCMAAGVVPSQTTSPCWGNTGLGNGAADVNENPGCGGGNDNWLAPLNMTSGATYALMVNNYTGSGSGFDITFGGTGTFEGPEADFLTNKPNNEVCVGQSIVFTDNSTFPNGSDGFAWNFGVDAVPQVASGPGPHTVSYTSPGTKSVVLTVGSPLGCVVSTVKTVQANACCSTVNAVTGNFTATDATCAGANQGSLTVNASTNYPPFTYQWANAGISGSSANNLYAGTYTVTITDKIGCDKVLVIPIDEPTPFVLTPNIVRPTCGGATDGSITMAVTGGTPSYQYNFGSGFSANNIFANLSNGTYPVTVRDIVGCDTTIDVEVVELALELDTLSDFVIEPKCFGYTDGSITITMANGQAPYLFTWNGGTPTSNNSLFNLGDGTYTVFVQDADNCVGGPFDILVAEPETLVVNAIGIDVTCYDGTDGEAIAQSTGGNGENTFLWNTNQTDSTLSGLVSDVYAVTVTDKNGCTDTSSVLVNQPGPIQIPDIHTIDAYCYGDSNGVLTVNVTGGTAPFEYSLNGVDYQFSNVLDSLPAGDYTVYVRDAFGCEYTKAARVSQPWIFYVQAGDDQTIELGYEADLEAFANSLNATFTWLPADSLECPTCQKITAAPAQTTTYTVTATDARGCTAEDSVTVFVEIKRPYFVPNVFTPNADGDNDYFYVQGGPAIGKVRLMRVFDRWGGFIFETKNVDADRPENGWDGKYRGERVEPSVFVYYIEIEFVDGFVEIVKGDVTVLR